MYKANFLIIFFGEKNMNVNAINQANFSLGLRADDAKGVLIANGYNHPVSYHPMTRNSESTGILLGMTGGLGAFLSVAVVYFIASVALDQTASDFEKIKKNDSSFSPLLLLLVPLCGAILGVALPLLCMLKIDRKRHAQAEQLTAAHNNAMAILSEYEGCKFHALLSGEHVVSLVKHTDEKIWRDILPKLNIHQKISVLEGSPPEIRKFLMETEYFKNCLDYKMTVDDKQETREQEELAAWQDLDRKICHAISKEKGTMLLNAYYSCLKLFGNKIAPLLNTFVIERLTLENVSHIHALSWELPETSVGSSNELAEACKAFCIKNAAQIAVQEYLK